MSHHRVFFIATLFALFTLTVQQECNGTQFDREKELCCAGVLKSVPESGIAAFFYDCCGGEIFSTDGQKCCKGTIYNETTSFCYNETVLLKKDASIIFNCGAEQKDFGQFSCCGGSAVEVDRFRTLCCKNQVFRNIRGDFYYPECCDSIMIYRVHQICCEGTAHNFTVNELPECCGNKVFNRIKESCTGGVIGPRED